MRLSGISAAFLALFLSASDARTDGPGVGRGGNLRVCVVEGKGTYRKAGKYCPVLERQNSGVECVIGLDRLDCMRRIAKGTVDFSVFSSEDLLAARWADVDILVTDELRFTNDPFEYEVVAIVDNRSPIKGVETLRGSRFCHPGYGYAGDWSDTLANFFEVRTIPKLCDPNLSLMENAIKASAEFFSSACKAGPWVPDKRRDKYLKSLYPNLCASCYDPLHCHTGDKYWGRRGPLNCIGEQAGDIAWARLDDARLHFGLVNNVPATADPSYYSYFCQNGERQPVNGTDSPCVWIAKPWPVVAAKRKSAEAVSRVVNTLSHDVASSWQSALLNLIETYHVSVFPLRPQMPVDDYLEHAVGFQSANSFAECNPPRSITICTKSIVARHKCDWLAEAARAYGLEPQLQCMSPSVEDARNPTANVERRCFEAVRSGQAEVTMAHPDWMTIAERDFGLEPVLYETTPILNDLYTVVAVVKANSALRTFDELRGKRACFPKYEGVAWNSAVHHFATTNQGFKDGKCSMDAAMRDFFGGGICAPGAKMDALKGLCGEQDEYEGEIGALKCLVNGVADVAFIGLRTLKNNTELVADAPASLPRDFNPDDYRTLCAAATAADVTSARDAHGCYLAWAAIGHVLARADASAARRAELAGALARLDDAFGARFRGWTAAFSMYGAFERAHDALFADRTRALGAGGALADARLARNYETTIAAAWSAAAEECGRSGSGSGGGATSSSVVVLTSFAMALAVVARGE